MKRIGWMVALLTLTACGSTGNRASEATADGSPACSVRAAVERQLHDYPASTLLDLYKSFFQDRFGPGHIVSDSTAAGSYLRRELAEAAANGGYAGSYYEPAGCGEQFYRVSLAVIADGKVSYDTYFDAFMRSVRDIEPVEVERWRNEWQEIGATIAGMQLDLPDYAADSTAIADLLASGRYASHHSRAYNARYRPHYRLIRKDIFEKELEPIIGD